MKILGAKEILNIKGPMLVYEFWENSNKCRELLKDISLEKVLLIIKDNIEYHRTLENANFRIWIGDNNAQVYPLVKSEYDEDENELELTDINIVGDASPYDTLWFVFEKDEWIYLDNYLGIKISEVLNDIWDECEKISNEEVDNTWAKQELNNDWYFDCKDIIEANVEINLEIIYKTPEILGDINNALIKRDNISNLHDICQKLEVYYRKNVEIVMSDSTLTYFMTKNNIKIEKYSPKYLNGINIIRDNNMEYGVIEVRPV